MPESSSLSARVGSINRRWEACKWVCHVGCCSWNSGRLCRLCTFWNPAERSQEQASTSTADRGEDCRSISTLLSIDCLSCTVHRILLCWWCVFVITIIGGAKEEHTNIQPRMIHRLPIELSRQQHGKVISSCQLLCPMCSIEDKSHA